MSQAIYVKPIEVDLTDIKDDVTHVCKALVDNGLHITLKKERDCAKQPENLPPFQLPTSELPAGVPSDGMPPATASTDSAPPATELSATVPSATVPSSNHLSTAEGPPATVSSAQPNPTAPRVESAADRRHRDKCSAMRSALAALTSNDALELETASGVSRDEGMPAQPAPVQPAHKAKKATKKRSRSQVEPEQVCAIPL